MLDFDGRLQVPSHLDQWAGKVKETIGLKPARVFGSVNRGKSWYSVSARDFKAWVGGTGRRAKI